MGVLKRSRDIVNANINALLEKAEDPEKMLRLLLHDIEEALTEIKSVCARAMAEEKRLGRQAVSHENRLTEWRARARQAVERDRDDLAREALKEKQRLSEALARVREEHTSVETAIESYKADIRELEEKRGQVHQRRVALSRKRAATKRRVETRRCFPKVDTQGVVQRFERIQYRLDREEAEASLGRIGNEPTLEEKFATLERDETIEQELAALKEEVHQQRSAAAGV